MKFGARIVFMALLSTGSAQSGPLASRVLQGRVSQVSDFPPVGSGFTVTWISITVIKDEDLQRIELVVPYASDQQQLPPVGEDCLFRVHDGQAGGWIGRTTINTHDAVIIDSFRCGKLQAPLKN
jgi:hypothetical protein